MPIKPKYTSAAERETPETHREFTNREKYINIFEEKLKNKDLSNQDILCFYGMGGIGKTSLRKELCRILDSKYNAVWSALDFDLSIYRQEETALYYLRKSLKDKYKIHFPSFEIAYAVYWQKSHPNSPLNKESFPLIDDSGLLIDIFSLASGIPFVKIIPNLAKTLTKGKKIFRDWWTKRGQRELYDLPELEAKDILNRLPMYFAGDLRDYLGEDNRPCVFFFDTYEALWEERKAEGGYFLRDGWIRELAAHLPEPLWVITGREKLRWGEIDPEWESRTEQHLVGELSDSDSAKFLISCGIENPQVRTIIVKASKGVPHYLDLAVDVYFRIRQKSNREIEAKDFAGTQAEILDRFLKHLDRTEIETLKVLSAARTWNDDILKMLISKFNIALPFTALSDLYRFSFISYHEETNSYTMHDLIRESIQGRIDAKTLREINNHLFDYHDSKLADMEVKSISHEHCLAIADAFYYGKNFLDVKELFSWTENRTEPFKLALRWLVIIPLLDALLQLIRNSLGCENDYFLKTAADLGNGLVFSGLYKDAISVTEQAVASLSEFGYQNNSYLELLLSNLANAYYKQREYAKAMKIFEKVLEIKRNSVGEEHSEYAITLNNLALCYYETGQLEQAIRLKKQTAEILRKTRGENHHDYAIALINLSSVYKDMGRLTKAIELGSKALEIIRNAYGENHRSCAFPLNNIAISYRDLGQYDKAEELHMQAVRILRESIGENHPDYATILTNLAVVYLDKKDYRKAFELNEKILKLKEETLGKNHPDYAVTLNNLAAVYMETKDYESALRLLEDAVSIFEDTLGTNDITKVEPLSNLAFCCLKLGFKSRSHDLCRQAISVVHNLDEMMKPPLKEVLKRIKETCLELDKKETANAADGELSKLDRITRELSGSDL